MPPAVLKEPPPINMSSMVMRLDASLICSIGKLLKPEERGTVAWNQAFTAWSPTRIRPEVCGLEAYNIHSSIKALKLRPRILERISLLLVLNLRQRLRSLTSISTKTPIPPMIYSILMVNVIRYCPEKLIRLFGKSENPPLLKAETL